MVNQQQAPTAHRRSAEFLKASACAQLRRDREIWKAESGNGTIRQRDDETTDNGTIVKTEILTS